MNALAPAANSSAAPVVDPLLESEPDLATLVAVTAEEGYDSPDALAEKVASRVPPEHVHAVLIQAVTAYCRLRYAPRRSREEDRRPLPPPLPPPLPTPGPARKTLAADVLSTLPARLGSKVNVGSIRVPQWKLLGECTASDLVEAIGIRQELSRLNAAEAEWYVLLLDEMTETNATTVRDLLRLQEAG